MWELCADSRLSDFFVRSCAMAVCFTTSMEVAEMSVQDCELNRAGKVQEVGAVLRKDLCP